MSNHPTPSLSAESREKTGSRYSRRLRDAGKLPAVIYGHGQDPVSVTLDAKAADDVLHEGAHLVNVEYNGATESCLIRDAQYDYLGKHLIHIDLTRVDLSEEVELEIELVFAGEPEALKEDGAYVNHELNALSIRCRADQIPDEIRVDVSGLTTEQPMTVADLTLPDGVTASAEPDQVVAAIGFVAEQPEADEITAEATGAEPEIIEKGKKDDDQGNA